MAEFDLTQTIIPYYDRHLVFPLLAHLVDSELFPVEQVQAAQYELAKETNMVDYAVSLFQQLHADEDVPQGACFVLVLSRTPNFLLEFAEKREKAVSTNEQLQHEAQAVLDVIEKPEVAQALRQDKNQNLQFLRDHYGVSSPPPSSSARSDHFEGHA